MGASQIPGERQRVEDTAPRPSCHPRAPSSPLPVCVICPHRKWAAPPAGLFGGAGTCSGTATRWAGVESLLVREAPGCLQKPTGPPWGLTLGAALHSPGQVHSAHRRETRRVDHSLPVDSSPPASLRVRSQLSGWGSIKGRRGEHPQALSSPLDFREASWSGSEGPYGADPSRASEAGGVCFILSKDDAQKLQEKTRSTPQLEASWLRLCQPQRALGGRGQDSNGLQITVRGRSQPSSQVLKGTLGRGQAGPAATATPGNTTTHCQLCPWQVPAGTDSSICCPRHRMTTVTALTPQTSGH